MKIYVFKDSTAITPAVQTEIQNIIKDVSHETDVNDLVVAAYYSRNTAWTGGAAVVRTWQTRHTFITCRGRWHISAQHGTPQDLPKKFKLIRLKLPSNLNAYPKTEIDIYRWQHTFKTWRDHLAHLYAHELHHFRRYHLGMHPREGEHSANKWALQCVEQLNYYVTSKKLKTQKRKSKISRPAFGQVLNPTDFGYSSLDKLILARLSVSLSPKEKNKYIKEKLVLFDEFRQLTPGDSIHISFDPTQKYSLQKATIVRVMKRNSVRIVIRTQDGKEWRWPMAWLST